MSCSGVHREFNHRIKGIGHSSFSKEEASLLSSHDNGSLNSIYLANFNQNEERLRAPDGSASTVDVQLLRVWIRRKYIDKAWKSTDVTEANKDRTSSMVQSNQEGKNKYEAQPTRVKIPSKKIDETPVTSDLLGVMWDEAVTPSSTPVDDAWDAFSGSRENSSKQAAFQTHFDHLGQPANSQSQEHPNILNNDGGSSQSNFQPNFNDANLNQTSQAGQDKNQEKNSQHQNALDPKQYPRLGFNANFAHELPPQVSSTQIEPSFEANFQSSESGFQQQCQIRHPALPSHPEVTPIFSIAQSGKRVEPQNAPSQIQVPHTTVPPPEQSGFTAKFTDSAYGNHQPHTSYFAGEYTQQPRFSAKFSTPQSGNQQQRSETSVPPPQQRNLNATFSGSTNSNQQLHTANFSVSPGSIQQQSHTVMTQPQQPSFDANYPGSESVYDQNHIKKSVLSIQQPQPCFNTNISAEQNGYLQQRQSSSNVNSPGSLEKLPQPLAQQHTMPHQPPPLLTSAIMNDYVTTDSPIIQQQSETTISIKNSFPGEEEGTKGLLQEDTVKENSEAQSNRSNIQKQSVLTVTNDVRNSSEAAPHPQKVIPRVMDVSEKAHNAFDVFDAFDGLPFISNKLSNEDGIETNKTDGKSSESNTATTPSNYYTGQRVEYKDNQNNVSCVEIINIHLDDNLLPFFTVRMPDGREKQTDDKYLSSLSETTQHDVAVKLKSRTIADTVTQKSFLLESHRPKMVSNIVTMLQTLSEQQLEEVQQLIIKMNM